MKRLLSLLIVLAMMAGAMPALAGSDYMIDFGGDNAALGCTPVDSADEALIANIELAANAISGYYLPHGSYFSFNDVVGPRTEEAGYLPAMNGRGVITLGGGVGQVATTLHLALEQIRGVEFDSLAFYGDRFSAGYVDSGEDAVLVDYANGVDFSFYNYAQDMIIEIYTDGEYVYCSVMPAASVNSWNMEKQLIGSASLRANGTAALKNNIDLACGSLYDVTIGPGGDFSFNDIVGPRTAEYGYLSAVNGRGVDVIGGGVGQVASVLYLAIKDLDCIDITKKYDYGSRYNQTYVSNPADAVVVDYANGADFTFRYTGTGALSIYTWLEEGRLMCEIHETKGW